MARRCWPSETGVWLPSLRQGQRDEAQLFQSLGTLYVNACNINWTAVHSCIGGRRVSLPNYPFQRQRYWAEPSVDQPIRRRIEAAGHPLLGVRRTSPLEEMQFQSRVSAAEPSFLNQHRIYDTPVFPASAYIEMVCAAAETFFGSAGAIVIEDLVIEQALLLNEKVDTTLQLILRPAGNGEAVFGIFSQARGEEFKWTRHAGGKVRLDLVSEPETLSLATLQSRCCEAVPIADFYRKKRERGLQHGPQFQAVVQLHRSAENDQSLGLVDRPENLTVSRSYKLHPALLDAC
jgi:acyl transferase domain-containing protein